MKQVNSWIFTKILVLMLGLFLSTSAFAQVVVKGLVKDDLGEPLPGARIVVKGDANNGAVTDLKGNFTLQAKKGATLVFSYIGYATKELTASSNMVVTMMDDTKTLNDVVVIGYGTAKKSDLTGSVTVVKPDEENQGFITSAQDLMTGKIAGVNVISDGGEPGAGATIRVRGGSSLNASNDPLIVIDGLALDNNGVQGVSNPLSLVNPSDIESFTVLKDASATAIYGSRGSNGVIIITTKKGKAGSPIKVSYNGNVSVSTLAKKMEVMTGDEYRDFIKSYYGDDIYNELRARKFIGDENTDWQDEIYNNALSSTHNITLQGGLKHMPYRISAGFSNFQGLLKTSDNKRTNLSVSLNPSLADDHLKINLNGKFQYNERTRANGGAIGAAVAMNPTVPVYSNQYADDVFGGYWEWATPSAYQDNRGYMMGLNSNGTKNPVAMLELRRDLSAAKQFVGNAEFDYAIHGLEDLHLHMNLGADYSKGQSDVIEQPTSPNNFYYGYQGWYAKEKYNLQMNAYAQYAHTWKQAHDLSLMAGYEWQHYHNETSQDQGGMYPLTFTGTDSDGNSLAGKPYTNWTTTPGAGENYLVSFFGRAVYSLLGRYSLTATVRRDGSSRFREHWATFPSFAFAWRINEEKFMQNAKNLSQMKLRLGYGKTGQQDGISDYAYLPTYTISTSNDSKYPVSGDGTLVRPNEYNPDLIWETTTTYNAALDLGFWNNRLTASVDFYRRETTDLLNTVYVAAGSNFRNKVIGNIGSMLNQGVELQMGYVAIDKKDWTWELGFNATYNHNEITEITANSDGTPVATGGISAGTGGYCQAHAKGQTASSFYVYQQVYDKDGMPIEGAYVDRDGNGVINESDKYFYKAPAAPWIMGLSSKLRYKNWDFGFNLRASIGNYVYNDTEAGWSNVATTFDQSLDYLSNRPTYELPKAWKTWDNALSDYFVHNASFLKCDNLTLGYSFPAWTRHKISGRIYASVSNVFTITKYNGLDPEISGGIDNNMYPRPRTYQIGVNLNF